MSGSILIGVDWIALVASRSTILQEAGSNGKVEWKSTRTLMIRWITRRLDFLSGYGGYVVQLFAPTAHTHNDRARTEIGTRCRVINRNRLTKYRSMILTSNHTVTFKWGWQERPGGDNDIFSFWLSGDQPLPGWRMMVMGVDGVDTCRGAVNWRYEKVTCTRYIELRHWVGR